MDGLDDAYGAIAHTRERKRPTTAPLLNSSACGVLPPSGISWKSPVAIGDFIRRIILCIFPELHWKSEVLVSYAPGAFRGASSPATPQGTFPPSAFPSPRRARGGHWGTQILRYH